MGSLFRTVKAEPALAPLFAAVGLGVIGSVGFAAHYLAHNQDVVINRSGDRQPWNDVPQGKNTKLMSFNREWWASRADLPDPRAAFLPEGETLAGKARAIRDKVKAKAEGK